MIELLIALVVLLFVVVAYISSLFFKLEQKHSELKSDLFDTAIRMSEQGKSTKELTALLERY